MRSLYQNLEGEFDITVIGDIPDWIDQDEVRCIEFDNHHLEVQRQTKINQKILKARSQYSEFLVMNDDIYIMEKMSQEEIKIPRRNIAELNYDFSRYKGGNSFIAQMKNSFFKLTDLGRPANINWVSHTPHFYETEKINEIMEEIDLAPLGHSSVVFENIYHNYFSEQGLSVEGYRWGCWQRGCAEPTNEKIINHDERGASSNLWLKELLENKFHEKCKAEK